MNYRHVYHAGNFADVLKHVMLTLVIEHLKLKPAPFRVIDTHAGAGAYDLTGAEAAKTGEWDRGVSRLLGPQAAAIPPDVAAILAPYLDVVRHDNPPGTLRKYPGSPRLALALMRSCDRLIANELHPADAERLVDVVGSDLRARALCLDGWTALKAQLPPKERRGVVLIDPPFEEPDEFERIVGGLREARRRFATGTFLVWYPIKSRRPIAPFHQALEKEAHRKVLVAELLVRSMKNAETLNGCGVVVMNPPHTLAAQLKAILPFLSGRLAHDAHAAHHLRWLKQEDPQG